MNQVILTGNLATEPEVRVTQSDVTVCTFRLAVQRKFKNPESGVRDADFIPIVAWRQLGQLCGKYLAKGKKAAVVGHLEIRSFEGSDGVRRYVTEVIADDVEFLSKKNEAREKEQSAFLPAEGGYCNVPFV